MLCCRSTLNRRSHTTMDRSAPYLLPPDTPPSLTHLGTPPQDIPPSLTHLGTPPYLPPPDTPPSLTHSSTPPCLPPPDTPPSLTHPGTPPYLPQNYFPTLVEEEMQTVGLGAGGVATPTSPE